MSYYNIWFIFQIHCLAGNQTNNLSKFDVCIYLFFFLPDSSGKLFRRRQSKIILLYYKFFWFGLMLYVSVNSYGHVRTVSSPNHTFSWASLTKLLTSTSCTYFRLSLTTTLLESAEGRRMAIKKFHDQSQRKYGNGQGWNLGPLNLQSDTYL